MSVPGSPPAPKLRERLVFRLVRVLPDRPKPLRAVAAHRLAGRDRTGTAVTRVAPDLELELDLSDWLSRLYFAGATDQELRGLAMRLVPVGGVAIDVGANVGLWTCALARAVGPRGHVVAVEPFAANLARLRANVERNGLRNVRILELALSDRAGGLPLFAPAGHRGGGSGSIGARDPGGGVFVGEATCARLDEVFHGPRLDLMKVDVEGHELEVLAGSRTTIEQHRPVIVCEVIAPGVAEGVMGLCGELGYRALGRTGRGHLAPPDPRRPASDLFLIPAERRDVPP